MVTIIRIGKRPQDCRSFYSQIDPPLNISCFSPLGINEVTFNESRSSAFFTNSTPLSDMNSLVAQFRTRQNNTVILSSAHEAAYFEITVNDGRANISYNLAGNMTGIVTAGNEYKH